MKIKHIFFSIIKSFVFIGFLFLSVVFFLSVVIFQFHIPHHYVQEIVEKQISTVLLREVKIGSLSGDLLTCATLRNVRIADGKKLSDGSIIEIKQLKARYSLLRVLRHKGDFLAGISTVKIDDAQIDVVRNQLDQWNILTLLPPPPEGVPTPPCTFKGEIQFKNVSVYFTDQKGWGKTLLSKPFTDSFSKVEGVMDFDNPSKARLNLKGVFDSAQSFFWVHGLLDANQGQYRLRLTIPKLNLDYWGDYIFPYPGFRLYRNFASIEGSVISKKSFSATEIPFFYDLMIQFDKTALKIPFFDKPITDIIGKAHFADNQLQFISLQGSAYSMTAQGAGTIDLTQNQMAFTLQTNPFPIEKLKGMFPVLEKWHFVGQAISTLEIKGGLENPKISGRFNCFKSKIYSFDVAHIMGNYTFFDKKLLFSVTQSQAYQGVVTGNGQIDLSVAPFFIQAHFFGKNLRMQSLLPKLHEYANGSFNFEAHLNGKSNDLSLNTGFSSDQLSVFNQHMNRVTVDARILDNRDILIQKGALTLHDTGLIYFDGFVRNLTDLTLSYQGSSVPFYDVMATQNRAVGYMDLSGSLSALLIFDFWKDPLSFLSATLNMTLNDAMFDASSYQKIQLSAQYDRGQVQLNHLIFKNANEEFFCQGRFFKLVPISLSIQTSKLDIGQIKIFQKYLPDFVKPFTGICDVKVQMTAISSQIPSVFKLKNYQITANIQVSNAVVLNQSIQTISTALRWDGQTVFFDQGVIEQPVSKILFSGSMDLSEQKIKQSPVVSFKILEKSSIDLSEFPVLLSPFGVITGVGNCTGGISGVLGQLQYDFSLDIQKPRYNFISFDRVYGKVNFNQNIFKVDNLIFLKNNDQYQLNGWVNLTPFFSTVPFSFPQVQYKGDLMIQSANIDSLSDILENFYQEIKTRLQSPHLQFLEVIRNSNVQVSPSTGAKKSETQRSIQYRLASPSSLNPAVPLFSAAQSVHTLGFFNTVQDEQQRLIKPSILGFKNIWKGTINGSVHVASTQTYLPAIQMDIQLSQAEIAFLKAKEVFIQTHYQNQELNLSLIINQGNIGGKDFESITSEGKMNSKLDLTIINTNITTEGRSNQNVIKGFIPLSTLWDSANTDQMNIAMIFTGNDIGVLSILNKNIDTIQNEGVIQARFTGSLYQPLLNSEKIELKNAKIFFSRDTFFKSPLLVSENHTIVIRDNQIMIPPLHVEWQGEDTAYYQQFNQQRRNQFDVSGRIDIRSFSFVKPDFVIFNFDMKMEDTEFTVNLVDIYKGTIGLSHCTFQGNYVVPFSKEAQDKVNRNIGTDDEVGPVLKADIALSNGVIAMPKLGEKKVKPSFLFDIHADIGKEVFVEGSVFGTGFLAGLANTFSLKVEGDAVLQVSGGFNAPKIDNKLFLESGSVNLFNRTFTLMDPSSQALYYRDQPEKVEKNTLFFASQIQESTRKRRVIPFLKLKALTDIEIEESLATQNTDVTQNMGNSQTHKIYKDVVVRFDGSIYELNSIYFDTYKIEDPQAKNRNPIFEKQYVLVGSGQNATNEETLNLLKLLMPDLLLRAGIYYDDISRNGLESDKARQLMNDIGARQLDLWIKTMWRPVERGIAKRIGIIDDFQVEYQIGNKLLNMTSTAMGLKQAYGSDEPILGFSIAKNISDQLVLKSVANIDTKSQGPAKVTRIELIYYILRNLSLNYSQERLYEDEEFKPKFSIKGTYEF